MFPRLLQPRVLGFQACAAPPPSCDLLERVTCQIDRAEPLVLFQIPSVPTGMQDALVLSSTGSPTVVPNPTFSFDLCLFVSVWGTQLPAVTPQQPEDFL